MKVRVLHRKFSIIFASFLCVRGWNHDVFFLLIQLQFLMIIKTAAVDDEGNSLRRREKSGKKFTFTCLSPCVSVDTHFYFNRSNFTLFFTNFTINISPEECVNHLPSECVAFSRALKIISLLQLFFCCLALKLLRTKIEFRSRFR